LPLVAGIIAVFSYQLSVISYQFSVISCQLSVFRWKALHGASLQQVLLASERWNGIVCNRKEVLV